jgi:branched-chain amino acid:cation transporter, LIVCS family
MTFSTIRKLYYSPVVATALALFAMLFGSGNIAIPLGLGRDVGSMATYAMIGFFLAAVMVPVLGIIAMGLYEGDYQAFMERTGTIPGKLIVALCLFVMGPLCIIPRCIALSYLAISWIMPDISLFTFAFCVSCLIFLITIRQNAVVGILSRYLGPIKLILLLAVIVKGFFTEPLVAPCFLTGWKTFSRGIFEGYGTLDLLGVIFFSGMLLHNIKQDEQGHVRSARAKLKLLIKAGALGAILLGILYAGFIVVASLQSGTEACLVAQEGQLLSVLATIILGAGGGTLASITLALACLTTAVALTTIFADYLTHQLVRFSVPYKISLLITLMIATAFANYGFAGIKALLLPIVVVLYPALIVLTCTNILYKMWNVECGKFPFYITLFIALVFQLQLFKTFTF